MTDEERKLLLDTAKQVVELSANRNDILVGIMVALLDLYRELFAGGLDAKDTALARLQTQHRELVESVGGLGTKSLEWLINSLETDKLDAAWLLQQLPAGSA
jgi:hypothetical protein